MESITETRDYRIDEICIGDTGGLLGMAQCPGRKLSGFFGAGDDRDLDMDLQALQAWGTHTLVSLVELEELDIYGVADLPGKALARGIRHLHLPITDMDIPDHRFDRRWTQCGPQIRALLIEGERVLLHCLAGLGRTGTVAARILVELGMTPESAIGTVRRARPGTIQTIQQEQYIRALRAD